MLLRLVFVVMICFAIAAQLFQNEPSKLRREGNVGPSRLSQKVELFELSPKFEKIWMEDCQYYCEPFFVEGPKFVKQQNGMGFVWQFATFKDDEPGWRLTKHLPYLVIFKDIDSAKLMTDLEAGNHGTPEIYSVVRFQCEQFSGFFGHTYDRDYDDKDNPFLDEEFYFVSGDEMKYFDLSKGQIFVVRKLEGKNGYCVEQVDAKLPEEALLHAFTRPPVDLKQCCENLEKWFSSL